MTTVSRAVIIGFLFGLAGVSAQLFLLRLNLPWTGPLRGAITFLVAILIGTLAGLTGKSEAMKAAGLAGFVAGVLMSIVGLSLAVRNPEILGAHPFASVETALDFVSSILFGTVISSWLVAGVAVLAALPISQVLQSERSRA